MPAPEPSSAQLLSEALVQRAIDPREAIRGARRVMRGPRRALRKATEAVVAAGTFAWAGIAAPRSPFNFDVGPHRRFAWVRASLADMKLVKNELGGTVNDVILAAVAGALGRYLRKRGHPTVGLELRAMVPVSVRTEDQHGSLGNQVTTMMAPLPVWCEDPKRRMEIVRQSMGDLKQSKQAMGATLLDAAGRLRPAHHRQGRPRACSRGSASSTSWSRTSPGRSSRSICWVAGWSASSRWCRSPRTRASASGS